MVLGALLIQKKKGQSDRKLVKEITANPYLQYFMGMPQYQCRIRLDRMECTYSVKI